MNLDLLLISIIIVSAVISLLSGLWLLIKSFLTFRAQINYSINMDLEIVRVSLPTDDNQEHSLNNQERPAWKNEIKLMEQWLGTLSALRVKKTWKEWFYGDPYIALEITNPSDDEEISFYLSVPKKFRERIEKQIHSFFPEAKLEGVSDYTIFTPNSYTAIAFVKLKEEPFLPLKTYETMDADPLNEISNAISKLNTIEEGATLQLVLGPAPKEWRRNGLKIAHEMQQGKQLKKVYHSSWLGKAFKEIGKGILTVLFYKTKTDANISNTKDKDEPIQLTPEEQELIKTIETKAKKPAFQVNIRIISSASTPERAEEILAQMENSLAQFENPEVNNFVITERKKDKKMVFNYIFRNFNPEKAIILGVEEIASLFHFPTSLTKTPKIKWLKSGTAPPPVHIPQKGILLGFNDYRGVKTEIRLADNDRRRHLYTIGQTGTGKSTFLTEMAKQDVKNGKGICVVDPHGDLVEDILTAIPKERAEDVIYFNPADTERPLGLNMLEYEKPEEKSFVVNEMISIFDRLYDLKQTGGPMFEQYARNAMLLIMEHPESGSTLMEISKVLANEDFRKMKLDHCKNQVVKDFWIKEAEKAGGEAALANIVPYVTSKLNTFVTNDIMRPIIAQQKSSLDFREIMDSGKILLVNLSKGKLGEINSHLLGMVVVGKILMAALSRVDLPEKKRKDFYLYIDEFQNVTTDSIAQILSEARKYHLNLIIAHQFIGQLSEEISKAVFGNVGSLCAFRVGPEDAEFLEKQFEPIFHRNDLININNYSCYTKLLLNGETSRPFDMKTYPPSEGDQELANNIKELSRLKYGRDKKIIEEEINSRNVNLSKF